MSFGDALRAARQAARLSQRELGERLGVSQPRVACLEADSHTPESETVRRVEQVLGTHLHWLVEVLHARSADGERLCTLLCGCGEALTGASWEEAGSYLDAHLGARRGESRE